jgi:uncharacterized protein (DUF1015 family)
VDTPDGVNHTLWYPRDQNDSWKLWGRFSDLSHFYIADGHHRFEAAYQY